MKNRSLKLLATGAIGMLALTGCAAAEAESVSEDNSDNKDLTIAVFNGWDEGIAASELWKAILDEKGYNVELEYADVAVVYSGLASGDYDLNLDVWLPNTHAEYLDEYGDDITEIAAWNDEAKNTIAVNADAPIDTIAELAENADLFNNTIVGIEPGAGLTLAVTDKTIPAYGLEGMNYQTSSTAAMLTELTAAQKSGENIAVTLWEPHWAYGTFDLKNLEDPEGTLGVAESIHAYGKKDFSTDFPQAEKWLAGYKMDLDRLQSLEAAMFVDYDGQDYGPIVEKWIEENQDYVDSLTA
ncbi:glycine betaine ABC transporter substrate-binding protein [Cryobacterium soli]|jgi:glycine betaine/proline transport system substrate-binding protein|uniref:glycine betaine ABC transporter substrate-binding protein n=1 Tax=Cryobacterium soli TaxID=2220095 RepID=UPI000E76894D|nr:glycine betaine ABC transporter substrate-binding protein [Cryobacterium soli]